MIIGMKLYEILEIALKIKFLFAETGHELKADLQFVAGVSDRRRWERRPFKRKRAAVPRHLRKVLQQSSKNSGRISNMKRQSRIDEHISNSGLHIMSCTTDLTPRSAEKLYVVPYTCTQVFHYIHHVALYRLYTWPREARRRCK